MSEIQSIAQRVRATIAKSICVDASTVTDDKTLADFGGDSLDEVEAVMSIEDEFSVEISDHDAQKLASQPVREYVQYVEARMAAKVA